VVGCLLSQHVDRKISENEQIIKICSARESNGDSFSEMGESLGHLFATCDNMPLSQRARPRATKERGTLNKESYVNYSKHIGK
jgi:hypothetical protein